MIAFLRLLLRYSHWTSMWKHRENELSLHTIWYDLKVQSRSNGHNGKVLVIEEIRSPYGFNTVKLLYIRIHPPSRHNLDTKSPLYIYTLSCFPTSQRCILIFLFKWLLTLFLLVISYFPILRFYHFLKHYNGKTSQHFQNRLWHVALQGTCQVLGQSDRVASRYFA